MERYSYQIFVPGGNKTALVFGREDDAALRKVIQDKIFAAHEQDEDGEVEQVGFVGTDKSLPQLTMAGGEFCGNATRAAAAYYLEGREGKVEIAVSGAPKPLLAGITPAGEVWAQMPIFEDVPAAITSVGDGLFWVDIEGISHLIVSQTQSLPLLKAIFDCKIKAGQTGIAFDFLSKIVQEHSLSLDKAYGIIFLENIADVLKMHPFVHVVASQTTFYETGCGSGAMCVGLVSSMLRGEGTDISLLQPSGKIIKAVVEYCGNNDRAKGKILGDVERGATYEVEV